MTANELRALVGISGGKPATLLGHYYVAAYDAVSRSLNERRIVHSAATLTAFLGGHHHRLELHHPQILAACYESLAEFLSSDVAWLDHCYTAMGLPPGPL